jgi:hypothetical protein
MHNNIFSLGKKPLPYQRRKYFIDGNCIIFSVFFCLVMFHEPQTWGLMVVKKCKLYILYILILFHPLHLTIGSKLILTQSEL